MLQTQVLHTLYASSTVAVVNVSTRIYMAADCLISFWQEEKENKKVYLAKTRLLLQQNFLKKVQTSHIETLAQIPMLCSNLWRLTSNTIIQGHLRSSATTTANTNSLSFNNQSGSERVTSFLARLTLPTRRLGGNFVWKLPSSLQPFLLDDLCVTKVWCCLSERAVLLPCMHP